MISSRKRRLIFILVLLFAVSLAATLALFALRQNIDLYYTPSKVLQSPGLQAKTFRLGGLVMKGSVDRVAHSLQVRFVLTDFHHQIVVQYKGILPSLFREGQGIVAQGHLNGNGVFIADQVLAKHDATYKPPDVEPKA